MSLLIVEAYETVDLPLPDTTEPEPGMPSEFDRKLGYWTNALTAVIPLEDLHPSFVLATELHEDPRRAVNPFDVKKAHKVLLSRRAEARREEEKNREESGDLGPCPHCGVGVVEGAAERIAEKWVPSEGRGVTLPCSVCRPKACQVAWEQWCERNGVAVEAGSVAQVVEAGKKILGETLRCDSCKREVNTYMTRFKAGGRCGDLLNRYVSEANDEGDPVLCDGTLEKV